MRLTKLSLESLATLDEGRLAKAIALQLKRLADDCRDRPGLAKQRTLTLKLAFSPIVDVQLSEVTGFNLGYAIETGIPAMTREGVNLGCQKNGDMVFAANSPENVDQTTIFDTEPNQGGDAAAK